MEKLKCLNKAKIVKGELTVQKKKVLTFLTIGLLIIASFYAGYSLASPSNTVTISSGIYPSATSYTIYQEGSTYYAKNAYGAIDYSGTDATMVIQSALNALTPNRTWKEKVVVKGSFIIDNSAGPLRVPDYTIMEVYGKLKAYDKTKRMLSLGSYTELKGGIFDGNRGTTYDPDDNPIDVVIVDNKNHVYLEDITIVNGYGRGLFLCGSDITAERVYVSNCKRNIMIWSPDATTKSDIKLCDVRSDNSIENSVDLGAVRGVEITNLVMHQCANGVVGDSISDVEIANAWFYRSTGSQPAFKFVAGYGDCGDIKLVNAHAFNGYFWIEILATYSIKRVQGSVLSARDAETSGYSIRINGAGNIEEVILDNIIAYDNTGSGLAFWREPGKTGVLKRLVIRDYIAKGNWAKGINIATSDAIDRLDLDGYYGENGESDVLAKLVKNSGTATIPSGQTSVTVNHGLAGTPTVVTVTGTTSDTADAYVSAKTSTTFTITVPSPVGGDRTVYWYAEYKP